MVYCQLDSIVALGVKEERHNIDCCIALLFVAQCEQTISENPYLHSPCKFVIRG